MAMTQRQGGHLTWPKHYLTYFIKNYLNKQTDACALIVPTQRLDSSTKTSMKGGDKNKQTEVASIPIMRCPHEDNRRAAGEAKKQKHTASAQTTNRTTHNNHNTALPQLLPCVFD
eukprot:8370295-Ditylum_brightwellii.AAC.1